MTASDCWQQFSSCISLMHALTFTPLYGVQGNEPQCYLLRLGNDLTILLDCGWDEQFDTHLLDPLLR